VLSPTVNNPELNSGSPLRGLTLQGKAAPSSSQLLIVIPSLQLWHQTVGNDERDSFASLRNDGSSYKKEGGGEAAGGAERRPLPLPIFPQAAVIPNEA